MVHIEIISEFVFADAVGEALFAPFFQLENGTAEFLENRGDFVYGFLDLGFVQIGFENKDGLIVAQERPPLGLQPQPIWLERGVD